MNWESAIALQAKEEDLILTEHCKTWRYLVGSKVKSRAKNGTLPACASSSRRRNQ